MTDETTAEQLAEIDRDMADIERQVAELVEEAQQADYPQPETQPEPVQVREGRWRTRSGEEKNIRSCEPLKGAYYVWPWTDGFMTFQDNGRHQGSKESPNDLVHYLGPIEEQPQSQSQPQPQPEPDAAAIEELRSEVSYVQNLLGTERRRVTELEELVTSLRTINRGCENAVRDAGKQNDALRAQVRILQREADKKNSRIEFLETLNAGNGAAIDDYKAKVQKLQGLVDTARGQLETAATEHDSLSTQLEAVKAELVTQAETSRRLQIELDAAQQVPPAIADRFKEGWNQGTARAVETVLEWLEPIRLVDSAYLANATMQHLPQIMRHLTGLDSHAID